MKSSKQILTKEKLLSNGAELVCSFVRNDITTNADIERPGFYFVIQQESQDVLARYYSGNQRRRVLTDRIGFWKVYYRISEQRSSVDEQLARSGRLEVYYLTIEKLEEFLHIKRPGLISRIRDIARTYYTLHELNSMLFDSVEFPLQKK